ncbi:MAG: hypothetical protein KDB00_20930 [Planctomycetales bacterium]|nr:hypothetical protein [Planctomycetales bacterium]
MTPHRQSRRVRRSLERLETRRLLAADFGVAETAEPAIVFAQNQYNRFDVTGDGHLTPRDALVLINRMENPAQTIRQASQVDDYFCDTNGDELFTLRDVLEVINQLAIEQQDPISDDALLMAMYSTDSIMPPYELARKIHNDLTAIRTEYPLLASTHFNEVVSGILGLKVPSDVEDSSEFINLLERFEGKVAYRQSGDDPRWIWLQVNRFLNINHIAESFRQVAGVLEVEPSRLFGEPSGGVSVRDNTYTFTLGAGDCPSGCIYRATWQFQVGNDGVKLIKKTGQTDFFENGGDPLPIIEVLK